jgi:predicted PurR-regulated permease PerM
VRRPSRRPGGAGGAPAASPARPVVPRPALGGSAPAGRPSYPRAVDVGWSSLLPVAGLLVAVVVVYDLARSVDGTVVHVLLAVVGALALDRVVGAVERWTRLARTGAVTVVVTVTVALLAGIALLLVPAVVEQGGRVGDDAPAVIDDLVHLPVIGSALDENAVPEQAQRWLDEFPDRFASDAGALLGTVQTAATQVAGAVETLLLLVLLLVEGPALVGAVRQLLPGAWQSTGDRLARSVYVVIGRYAVGSVLLAVIAGVAAFLIGLAFGVPLVALAALWAFLWNFVPQLGGIVGGAGLVLLALTESLSTALVVMVVWVVYVQVENRVVQPVVVGRAVQLSPLTTMVVALLGVATAGLLGAVLAIPVVAAANAARVELRRDRVPP